MNSKVCKRRFLGLLACSVGLVSLLATSAHAQMPPEPKMPELITTQGHGEVKAKPDSTSVNFSVETKNATLAAARNENNKKMQAIIAALKGLGYNNLKLETQGINVYPLQDYQKSKLPQTIGYQVTNQLNVKVTGLQSDMLSEASSRIIDTALNAGANNMNGVNFYLNDTTPIRAQVLEQAVMDARRNAEVMAKAAQVKLSGLQSLEGSAQFNSYPRPMSMFSMRSKAVGASEADAAVPVETGETTVTSDVTARFKFSQ